MKRVIALAAAALSTLSFAAPLALLKDINRTLNTDSLNSSAAAVPGGAVLTLCTDNFGCDPWFTDGTSANTRPLRRSGSHNLNGYVSFGGKAYFLDMGLGSLWSTDGTIAGTAQVAPIAASGFGPPMQVANGRLFIRAYDGRDDNLWVSDGTRAGTFLLTQAALGSALVVSNDRAFFVCGPLWSAGTELCITDGTPQGTSTVKDINPGSAGGNAWNLAVAAGRVFFTAFDGQATALWSSDGTSAGTVAVANAPASITGPVIEHQGSAYFVASTQGGRYVLWKSDGFTATAMDDLAPVPASPSMPWEIVSTGSSIFMSSGNQLWRSNGSAGSAIDLTASIGGVAFRTLRAQGGDLYFTRVGAVDVAEWMIPSGTSTAQPVGIAIDASFPGTVNGVLIAATGRAWARDPVAGWQRLQSAAEAPSNSSQCGRGTAALGNVFMFAADDGINGCSLWRSDGTPAGTSLVKAITLTADSGLTRVPSFVTVGAYV